MSKEVLWMQKIGFEVMIDAYQKVEGLTKDEAIKAINKLLKDANPNAEVLILDEFSARTTEFKK